MAFLWLGLGLQDGPQAQAGAWSLGLVLPAPSVPVLMACPTWKVHCFLPVSVAFLLGTPGSLGAAVSLPQGLPREEQLQIP